MSAKEVWHIDTEYLKPGDKLWTARRGWFRVVTVFDLGVIVVPEATKEQP